MAFACSEAIVFHGCWELRDALCTDAVASILLSRGLIKHRTWGSDTMEGKIRHLRDLV